MKSISQRYVRQFSVLVIVTLFVCQVIGGFCPMVPSVSTAQAGIHHLHSGHAHVAHVMVGAGMCPDSLTSSVQTCDVPTDHSLSPVRDCFAETTQGLVSSQDYVSAPSDGSSLPLYTLLSTFRI